MIRSNMLLYFFNSIMNVRMIVENEIERDFFSFQYEIKKKLLYSLLRNQRMK